MKKKYLALAAAALFAGGLTACADTSSDGDTLRINLSYGNAKKTITYQNSPLEMPDGSMLTQGDLKPMWQEIEKKFGIDIVDKASGAQSASEMMKNNQTTKFKDSTIWGGNSIADKFSQLGPDYFVALDEHLDEMPDFKKYLEENPAVASAIKSYDGHIYYIPYIASIGSTARLYYVRESWVTALLNGEKVVERDPETGNATKYEKVNIPYDTQTTVSVEYQPINVGENAKPNDLKIDGILQKEGNENVIQLMNEEAAKNGGKLTGAKAQEILVNYIKKNYPDAEKPSDLYLGVNASYDMDELVALWRVVEANTDYLIELEGGNTSYEKKSVEPFFTRHSKYREDTLRFTTYINGGHVHGSDSYSARWGIDEEGNLFYTYDDETTFEALQTLSDINAEGLFYSQTWDLSDTSNFRSKLYGSDSATETPTYGFMTYDWPASTVADSLNDDVVGILPPLAKVNGVWQHYNENSSVIKPDGWAISKESPESEISAALKVFNYMFTEEGDTLQNYGVSLDENGQWGGPGVSPDNQYYPLYSEWTQKNAEELCNGDYATFLREYLGSQLAIGYSKKMGFEWQYTSARGLTAQALYNEAGVGMPTYEGTGVGVEGYEGRNHETPDSTFNPNFYKLVPPAFSLTQKQQDNIKGLAITSGSDSYTEFMFNIIRYNHTSNLPEGVTVYKTYEEYLAKFELDGVKAYEEAYQAAYNATK